MLELVGLKGRMHSKIRTYSKGMKQRLGIAQALLHDPEVIFLDEPTDGVDPVGRREIREMMQRLKEQGKTLFLNSHLLGEVELICDRVAILQRGRLIRAGDGRRIDLSEGVFRRRPGARAGFSGRRSCAGLATGWRRTAICGKCAWRTVRALTRWWTCCAAAA